MKARGILVSIKIFESCILKIYCVTRDLLMQPIRTIWTILVGDHPGNIPVEFGQISGLREEVVWLFPDIFKCKIVTPGWGQFDPRGGNLNNFGREPLDHAIYQKWKLWAL